jgi:hypothetical protein
MPGGVQKHTLVYTVVTAALLAFLIIKGGADPVIVVIAIASIATIFALERYYLASRRA